MSEPLISLCIPTNGVVEWVIPVLDSIYAQKVDENLFEVIVTDNGDNEVFRELMKGYTEKHANLLYKRTTAKLFLNEAEAYKCASGEFIKFLNHRTKLTEGALQFFLDFVNENRQEKPVVYFANGMQNPNQSVFTYDTFDAYVKNLSIWSSWSTGMGFWRSDFASIPEDTQFNELFPHTTVLFWVRDRGRYIIDNRIVLDEIPTGNKPKGKYDVFYAFAVEYMGILCDLLREGSISVDTFLYVKEKNLDLVISFYWQFVVKKNPCSYDLSSFDTSMAVYYSKAAVKLKMCRLLLQKVKNKIKL